MGSRLFQFTERNISWSRYVGAVTDPTSGAIVDRYSVPQRGAIPVRTVVPEVQEYQVYGQTMVPEVRCIRPAPYSVFGLI